MNSSVWSLESVKDANVLQLRRIHHQHPLVIAPRGMQKRLLLELHVTVRASESRSEFLLIQPADKDRRRDSLIDALTPRVLERLDGLVEP